MSINSWWEEHPMSYDWNEQPDDIHADGPCFEEVDRRMREGHGFAQGPGRPLFSNLIPYPSLKNKKVLEIGCGLGSVAGELARQGAEVAAVDLTRRAVELTAKRFKIYDLPGRILQADAEQLPFAENTFDYVWIWGVLHHTPGTKKAIAEVRRVLKPGGRTGIMMYNRHSIRNFVRVILFRGILQLKLLNHSLESLENRCSDGDIAKHYTPAGFKKLFADFAAVKISIFGQRSEIFPGYRRLPEILTLPFEPVLQRLLRKFGWFLFADAVKEHPPQ